MHDHHNNPVRQQGNNRHTNRAQQQMLAILEDFLLSADPDTIRQLEEHLASNDISLSAHQVIAELGRLVTASEGGHDD